LNIVDLVLDISSMLENLEISRKTRSLT